MFTTLKRIAGNFLATFAQANVDLWVDDVEPAPWGWYWARSSEEAIDILTCYFVTNLRVPSTKIGVEVIEFLSNNAMFWPTYIPVIDHTNPLAQKMEEVVYVCGPYARKTRL